MPRRRWFSPILAMPTPVIFGVAAAWRSSSCGDKADWPRSRIRARCSPRARRRDPSAYAGSILLLGIRWHALVRMAGGAPHWTSSAEVFLTSVIVNYAAPIGLAVPTRAALTIRDLATQPQPERRGRWLGGRARCGGVVGHLCRMAHSWRIGTGADDIVDSRVLVLIAVIGSSVLL